MRVRALAGLVALSFALPAFAEAPALSTRPAPRPAVQAAAPVAAAEQSPALLAPVSARYRPLDLAARNSKAAAGAQAKVEATRLASIDRLLRPVARPDTAQLSAQRVAFVAPAVPDALVTQKGALCGIASLKGRKVAPVVSRVKGCGIADPVEVTAVDGVPLSQPALIDCGTAQALDRWVKTGLKRAIGGQGGGVARINIAGSYTCRPMNNVRGNKVSEHGRGKAVDVSGIVLKDGTVATIARNWRDRKTGPALKAAYRAGCGIFGTTLGPGSDGYHEDHLHFDTAQHRNGAYCR